MNTTPPTAHLRLFKPKHPRHFHSTTTQELAMQTIGTLLLTSPFLLVLVLAQIHVVKPPPNFNDALLQQQQNRQQPRLPINRPNNLQFQQHQQNQQQQQQKLYQQKQQQQQQQRQPPKESIEYYDEEEEEENKKPDRLQLLLRESKFNCKGKKDGYYADDTLNCEVFHYCQESKPHSWLCPNNFAFHQVHLICVPPSSDNICKQSADFHFVNEYLYRPINAKEAERTNTSLVYSDRYYPEGYTPGLPLDEMFRAQSQNGQNLPIPRAPVTFRRPSGNGYYSAYSNPENINIPLSQRRPLKSSKDSAEYEDEY